MPQPEEWCQAKTGRRKKAGPPWYAGAQGEAWRALGIKSAPVMIGIRKGRIGSAISGLLNDPATLTSAIRTWVEF